MKLEVHERLALLSILPKEGDYAALKTIRRAREMISFTQDETVFFELKNITGANGVPQVSWNDQKAREQVKDCPIDEYTTNVIRNKLAEMDRNHKLTEEYMSLYEKFVVIYQ